MSHDPKDRAYLMASGTPVDPHPTVTDQTAAGVVADVLYPDVPAGAISLVDDTVQAVCAALGIDPDGPANPVATEREAIAQLVERQERFEVNNSDQFVEVGLGVSRHPEGRLISRATTLAAIRNRGEAT